MDKISKVCLIVAIICGIIILGVVIYSATLGHGLTKECREVYSGHVKPGGYCYYVEDGESKIYNIWDNAQYGGSE